MKHYLFCLRHYNDIDNIAPAIYFLLERKPVRVTVLVYSLAYDYRSDPSLSFLLETFADSLRVIWVGGFFGYPYAVTNCSRLRLWHYRLRRILRRRTVEREISGMAKDGHLQSRLSATVSHWGIPQTIVFDQNRTPVILGLIQGLRNAFPGVRIISLPVSPWINYNVLRQTDYIKIDAAVFRDKHDYSGFDEIGQVDAYYATSLERFFSLLGESSPFAGRISILGSIRFCSEWLKIRDTYGKSKAPRAIEDSSADSRVKLLVLPSHEKNNSFWAEFIRTLEFVSHFEQYRVIVKPHTRYTKGYENLPEKIELMPQVDTSALIDWADTILYWSTSVALEGFQKNKTMVCLDYINANTSIFAALKAGIICRSRDDLFEFLVNYQDQSQQVEELPNEASEKIAQLIGDRCENESVVARYLRFMTNE